MPNFNVFLDFQEGQLVTTCIYRLYWYPSYVTSNVKNNLQVLSPWSPKTHSRSRSWNNWANSSAWWLAGRNWPGHPPPSFPQHRVDWLKFRVPTFRNLSACWLEVYWLNFRVPTFRNLSDCWLEVYWQVFSSSDLQEPLCLLAGGLLTEFSSSDLQEHFLCLLAGSWLIEDQLDWPAIPGDFP